MTCWPGWILRAHFWDTSAPNISHHIWGLDSPPSFLFFFCFDDIRYEKRKNFNADDGEVMMAQLAERSIA